MGCLCRHCGSALLTNIHGLGIVGGLLATAGLFTGGYQTLFENFATIRDVKSKDPSAELRSVGDCLLWSRRTHDRSCDHHLVEGGAPISQTAQVLIAAMGLLSMVAMFHRASVGDLPRTLAFATLMVGADLRIVFASMRKRGDQ
jgi:hypothetical protein